MTKTTIGGATASPSQAAQFGAMASSGGSNFAAGAIPTDRLIRAEVALGIVREIVPPESHIGLSQIAPFMDVATDDVIFGYMNGSTTGLAPARSEDAESELFQQDDGFAGEGRASTIDWAIKSHYTASQINRYREYVAMVEQMQATGSVPLTIQSPLNQFQEKIARDRVERRRRIDNRLEKLIIDSIADGVVGYSDGKTDFEVDWQRPADQHAQAPKSGAYTTTTHDPINDIIEVSDFMNDTYGVRPKRMIAPAKFLNTFFRSAKFITAAGIKPGDGLDGSDLPYLWEGFGPQAALDLVKRVTNIEILPYDSVWRARGSSGGVVANRYLDENRVIFLPDESEISEYDSSPIGFAKTLTSPHPMGNWTSGYYEFEYSTTDPWAHAVGDGIKAFPVFPHMELTYTWEVEY